MSRAAIVVEGLVKRFDTVTAVDRVSFTIGTGELFGLLGPNGAGKTTTINLLTGLARPDSGALHIAGVDGRSKPKAAQHMMGVVPDESNLYPELSGRENLRFCGALYGLRKSARRTRTEQLLDAFGLRKAADRKFATYSKGMRRKLTIAAGIIHHPEILFLDEPTTGIDVASARQIRQLITDLHKAGTTILLTTHYIEEAERLCERIAFIVEGSIVRLDTLERLMQHTEGRHVVEFSLSGGDLPPREALHAGFPTLTCEILDGRTLRVSAPTPVRIGPVVRFLEDRGAEISEARTVRPSLEDVFVEVTGIEAGAMTGSGAAVGRGTA